MKALTLTQPWCSLIVSGTKRIENRVWKPPLAMSGVRFALHASKVCDPAILDMLRDLDTEGLPAGDLPLGAILGVATLVDYVSSYEQVVADVGPDQVEWWSGPYAFVLEDIRQFKTPIPCRGFQKFWTVDDDVLAAIEEQLRG